MDEANVFSLHGHGTHSIPIIREALTLAQQTAPATRGVCSRRREGWNVIAVDGFHPSRQRRTRRPYRLRFKSYRVFPVSTKDAQ